MKKLLIKLLGRTPKEAQKEVNKISSNSVLSDENCVHDFELLNDTGVQRCRKCKLLK